MSGERSVLTLRFLYIYSKNTLNIIINFFLGGIPEYLNTEYNYPGLVGCIEQVEFKDPERAVNLGKTAVAGRNAQPCRE